MVSTVGSLWFLLFFVVCYSFWSWLRVIHFDLWVWSILTTICVIHFDLDCVIQFDLGCVKVKWHHLHFHLDRGIYVIHFDLACVWFKGFILILIVCNSFWSVCVWFIILTACNSCDSFWSWLSIIQLDLDCM